MSNNSTLCPQCQNPVSNKDVICLACGTALKNLQGVSRGIEKSKEPRVIFGISASPLRKVFSFLFALLIFCVSAVFAWTYFKNFSGFYRVTDFLLMQGRFDLCAKVYSGMERFALSPNVEAVQFYKEQLQKEVSLGSKNKDKQPLTMRIVDYAMDRSELRLKLSLRNKTFSNFWIHNRCFYLKNQKGIFLAHFPNDSKKIALIPLKSEKSVTVNLMFSGRELSKTGESFDGKIVFNDGKRYATSDLSQ
jgi:hypothetical protein